ncbi:MAG: NAD(P)-dependent oxidoreductase [Elusimicrobiales bacterium]|nr:NAD(P)-dependent oxidoreductase [Elusimicrobiales bacterium]
MNYNKQTILLTGGSGFIGKNIKESYLSKKYNLIVPSHKELDLLDEKAVSDFFNYNRFDVVIHGACRPAHRNALKPELAFYENMLMYYNIIKNEKKFKKMLVLGSGAVYDMRHYKPKMDEDYYGTFIPIDQHGFSRYLIYKDIENRKNIIDLRIFGIFGKYEDYSIRFISNMICKSIFDLPLTIKQNRKFDYIWIDDFIKILDIFIEKDDFKYKSYNITPDNSVELIALAKIVLKISNKNLPIIVKNEEMGLEYSGDNSRLKKEIGEFSFTKFEDSIEKLYNWYLRLKNDINKDFLLADK